MTNEPQRNRQINKYNQKRMYKEDGKLLIV